MKKTFFSYILTFSVLLAGSACQTQSPAPDTGTQVPGKSTYVSSQLQANASLSVLQAMTAAPEYDFYKKESKYSVTTYKIVYTTTYKGQQIQASGLICVPHMDAPASILSLQHGTIFSTQEAPTSYHGISDYELLASTGYVTVIPDYIGFGESQQVPHPYYDQQHSALAVTDLIKAAKTFCADKDVALNEKLFLVGYSEGGYVTLAAQRALEANPESGLKVTASAAGAGGYDIPALIGLATSPKPYYFPASFAYLLHAYNQTNDWSRPLTDFFQEPYASKLPTLLNGTTNGFTINEQLPMDTKKLFSLDFYEGLKTDGHEVQLKQALLNNSFISWAPQSPTRLYHGTADEIIPYSNSQKTYDRFVAQGAKQTELIPIKQGNHESTYAPMMQSVLPWLKTF